MVGYIGQGEDEEDHEMWHVIHVRPAIAYLHTASRHTKDATLYITSCMMHSRNAQNTLFSFSMCANDDSFDAKLS